MNMDKKMRKYEQYVSLGRDCQARYQIDQVFNSRSPVYEPSKSFFDWLWGAGMDGVIKTIGNNMEISRDNLIIKMVRDAPQVYDQSTGYYFQHDFKFTSEAYLNMEVATHEMLNQLDSFISKYSHLADKTKRYFVKSEHVLFVYYGILSCDLVEKFYAVAQHISSMDGVRPPSLLNIIPSNVAVDSKLERFKDSLCQRTVNNERVLGTADEWMGDDMSWSKAFEDFTLA